MVPDGARRNPYEKRMSVNMDNTTLRFIRSVSVDWTAMPEDSYLRGIPAISTLDSLTFDASVTFLVGENGTGKSTVLEGIATAYGFNGEGGTLNYRFSTYDDVSELGQALSVARERGKARSSYFFRAESFFNLATAALKYGPSPRSTASFANLHEQSHGESFLSFFNAFESEGLYLMDEPESALSAQRQLSLLAMIDEGAVRGSQFIIATHSPILLGLPGATILDFDNAPIHPCTYEETDAYRITETFINHRESVLHHLLREQG
jgi:predicted ATPase